MSRHVALVVRVSAAKQDATASGETRAAPRSQRLPGPSEAVEFFEERRPSQRPRRTIFEPPGRKRAVRGDRRRSGGRRAADEQSRLVRGTTGAEWAEFFELCQDNDTAIHTVLEGVLDAGETGELISDVPRVGQPQRGSPAEPSRPGRQARSRPGEGIYPYAPIPYGTKRGPDKKLVRTEEADHVAAAFEALAAGTPKPKVLAAYVKARGKAVTSSSSSPSTRCSRTRPTSVG